MKLISGKKLITSSIAAMLVSSTIAFAAEARDQIRAVGSSTVYPFVTVAAEEFGQKTSFKTPIVESTGTGGGFKLFCAGKGEDFPDISNASRPIKDSEKELCKKNKVGALTEIKIGHDGIVMIGSRSNQRLNLTKQKIFLALAKQVPKDGKLVKNPYTNWNQIDKDFPSRKINVYGPPPTSGTRDSFAELVMEEACMKIPEYIATYKDEKERSKACKMFREDGVFIEAGENDNLIVQKVITNKSAHGIVGFASLDQHNAEVQGSSIEKVSPTFENIISGKYPVSRPLFVYIKNAHLPLIKGLKEFALEIINKDAIGSDGYLVDKGLIPLSGSDLKAVQAKVVEDLKKK